MKLNNIKQYQLVIFDWDGTLMDSVGKIVDCMQSVAQSLALDIPSEQAVRDIIGLSLLPALEKLFPHHGNKYDELIAGYKHYYLNVNLTPSPLFDGIEHLLAQLKTAGYTLAIATGKRRAGLDRMLAETGLGQYFVATRSADEAHSKPHPSMILSLLEELNINADQAVMIGDSKLDIAMANNAKVNSIAVTYGAHSLEDLLTEGPTATVNQPKDILLHI
ncbi:MULTISPECIES: HAD-IIIA family hydrolase [unclassified Shewanella]|uniref:HAD family hydrolase n=1 Tax=unclassified Shewanella TaxID=196818 RepID=UPI000C83E529|nr:MULTISPECIES: HAD-IIIA family hydrolase [unclassified Shewanella]MDO6618149.1 HAD-IIIA family hydrolase [Shewanella sp. 6_MG-2023]MDO6638421.1 HAD-IIIA family hydrolase [Shewanella sp. 5_MG-2023]MDO6677403.1 HAD-IIIA family hydrolase [Shewanella sp. 4_MG-2023]PMG26421.1 HAD family hydrolase [Shewanella sp. 10N.286.52.C2]PMG39322.1 HAD family hydrolase [Shewanella sp. 10N.286.52.B9]